MDNLNEFYLITKAIINRPKHRDSKECVRCDNEAMVGMLVCEVCNHIFDTYQFMGQMDLYYVVQDSNSFEEFKLNAMMGRLENDHM